MAKLDIEWLGVFVEIHKTHNVSLAAQRLGIAQARASAILGKLRRHFGDVLFARTSRGMEPTPFAEGLFPDVSRCFERLSMPLGKRDTFAPQTASRQFRIGMTDISEIVMLPMLVNALRRLAPGVVVEAERISAQIPARLESGEVDLAVGYIPSLRAGYYQQTMFRQGFVCVASKQHPRIRERPTRQAFCREAHLVVTASGTGHAIVGKEFAKRGMVRNVMLQVPSFLGVGTLVAGTELLATVPRKLGESLVEKEAVNMFQLPVELPTYAVSLHWHARFHADHGNIWLRKLIAQLMTG
jgi:DNA-binding transcriptional LysR family regulator